MMSKVKNKWDELWTYVTEDGYSGYGKSIEEAKQVNKAFEVENSLIFVSGKREASFGHHDLGYLSFTLS